MIYLLYTLIHTLLHVTICTVYLAISSREPLLYSPCQLIVQCWPVGLYLGSKLGHAKHNTKSSSELHVISFVSYVTFAGTLAWDSWQESQASHYMLETSSIYIGLPKFSLVYFGVCA